MDLDWIQSAERRRTRALRIAWKSPENGTLPSRADGLEFFFSCHNSIFIYRTYGKNNRSSKTPWFEACIFGQNKPPGYYEDYLVDVARDIAKRLKGSPLAANTVGRLLRKNQHAWAI